MMDSFDYDRFLPHQPVSATANFTNKYGDASTDVRYSTYRSSMLVRYSTLKYRPCNTTRYRQTQHCCRPSNSTKYKFCNLTMQNLIKLLKVFLLSFIIIMTGTDGSNTPRRSGRLNEVNNNENENQGTETEQFDEIERAAREAALLTTATETDP